LLVARLVATVIAVVNGHAAAEQARIAQARQLAAQAITLSQTDLQAASLLAVEAFRLHDDAQTRASLFRLATASPYLDRTLAVGAEVLSTAIGADGVVAVGDADGGVSLWTDGQRQDLLTLEGRVFSVAMDDAHDVVVGVGSEPETRASFAAVWAGGAVQRLDVSGFENELNYGSVSPDGRHIALTTFDTMALYADLGDGAGFQQVGGFPVGGRVGWGDGEITISSGIGPWARVSLDDLTALEEGQHIIPLKAYGTAVSGDGAVIAGQVVLGVNFALWDTHDAAPDAEPEHVATSQISGALDIALDGDGSRLAVLSDGAIYVSAARAPDELPEPPIALDGAGSVNPSSLSFSGGRLANGTGDYALVWDLDQAGRIATEFAAPVADPCSACGIPYLRVNDDGSRILTTDLTGFSTTVVDLATHDSVTVEPGDGTAYTGASWLDERRLIVYVAAARELRALSGADYGTVDFTVPVTLPDPDDTVLGIRASVGTAARATLIAESGYVQTVDLRTGEVLAETDGLVGLGDGQAPWSFDIAPDQSSAFVLYFGDIARAVHLEDGHVIYEAARLDGMAYDASSRLHVLAKGSEWVVDPATGQLGTARVATIDDGPPPILSPDGTIVVTGGTSGTVTLVALDARGTIFGSFPVPVESNRWAVSAFTPDGTALITAIQSMFGAGRDSTVRSLDLTTDDWIGSACAVAGRDLTPEEWFAYVGTAPPADLRCDR
jgi:WD40 repeat protein